MWPLFIHLLTVLQCSDRLHAQHFLCVCVRRQSFSLLVLYTPGITFFATLPVICGSRLAVKHVCVRQVLLDTLTVPRLVERLLRIFMQPEGFSPHSQESSQWLPSSLPDHVSVRFVVMFSSHVRRRPAKRSSSNALVHLLFFVPEFLQLHLTIPWKVKETAWWFRDLTFWHRSFTFNSNKSPTWCNNFSVYYPDVCLQQHVSGVFPPITRSSMTAVAASGFTFLSWWQSCCDMTHGS